MPTLHWLNDQEARKTSSQLPYRLLEAEPKLSCGDSETENMLIQGDNLEALKALLPYYAGQVKCIYIDPPYNTGNAFEYYDDNLEHSTWLSLLYPRLEMLYELLSADGFFCCHIDDAESSYLKVLLDEIFGRQNYQTTLYIKVRYAEKTLKSDMDYHKEIEQIHIYRKSRSAKPILPNQSFDYGKFKYKIIEKGDGRTIELGGKRVDIFERGQYQILNQGFGSQDGLKEIWATGTILDGNSSGRFFRDYLTGRVQDDGLGVVYKVFGIGDDQYDFRYFTGPAKQSATKGKYYQGVPVSKLGTDIEKENPIENYYDFSGAFGNCRTEGGVDFRGGKKPEILLRTVLDFFSRPNDLILDSFLGSGTTAAVAHKMGRRYIGIEMGDHALTHCAPRLKKVVEGEQSGISKDINWQGGSGFRFCQLGETVFDEQGHINSKVKFKSLAAHVWFSEMHTPLLKTPKTPLLGIHGETAFYLLYNGILGDKTPAGGNVLTARVLRELPKHKGRKVIYGEMSMLDEAILQKQEITFKHIPYDIKAR